MPIASLANCKGLSSSKLGSNIKSKSSNLSTSSRILCPKATKSWSSRISASAICQHKKKDKKKDMLSYQRMNRFHFDTNTQQEENEAIEPK
jgi:hypothetical protein